MRLLIDGDQFIFKAAAAVEREVCWDEHNHALVSNADEAWDNLVDMLDRVFERFETKHHLLCFTNSPTFRAKIDSNYKAHRQTRKPLCYAKLRERVCLHYEVQWEKGLEADDVMGLHATAPQGPNVKQIVVSQDKDMKTIPATVWDGENLITYTEAEADYWHMYQTLVGDSSDGYKGCPGVGPVKAEKILMPNKLYAPMYGWEYVKMAYSSAGLTEEDALRNARLARILRWSDWDQEKKEPILWAP